MSDTKSMIGGMTGTNRAILIAAFVLLAAAIGYAFMTVIAAELVAAQSGVGHLIWNSRLFAQTDFVFVGIITLGLMGFAANWGLSRVLQRVAYRYGIHL